MTKKILVLSVLAALALALPAAAVVTRSSSPAVSSGDDSCAVVNGNGAGAGTDNIAFTETGTISDANIAVEVAHTWRSDLQMGVTYSVGGGNIQLIDDVGGGNDNLFVTFDSDAGATCATGCAAAAPCSNAGNVLTCSPSGSLNTFDGQTSPGTWTIAICDDSSAITGTLNTWSVTLDGTGQLPVELMGFSIE
jgi:subtilisin-like proprotein convertase family protein